MEAGKGSKPHATKLDLGFEALRQCLDNPGTQYF